MKRTAKVLLLGIILAMLVCGPVFAAQAEWRDSDYNFGTPKFVLVTDAKFAYEGYDVSGRNKFNRYPYAADKIQDMLRAKIQGLSRHRIVNLDYVIKQIKAELFLLFLVKPSLLGKVRSLSFICSCANEVKLISKGMSCISSAVGI